jgi:plasmid maintenance system antidote protein VapI/Zn-dependent peptidase ImmA (M78 family)
MSNQEFSPNWASAPGETIADILEERNLSLASFANLIGQSSADVKGLLEGRTAITIGTARLLERVLGGSVAFWMTRDFQYRESITRLHSADQQWLADVPLSDIIRFGWLKPIPHPSEQVTASLSFFGVPSVSAWRAKYSALQQMAAFRTSTSFESRPAAVAAWLRQGEIEGTAMKCDTWSPTGFQKTLFSIRVLTRQKDPHRFLPELQKICAANGVAVVIVRAPNGCRASGATWFISTRKALLLLSFRHLSDDQFWFSFFHEAGHLLLHGIQRLFLEGVETAGAVEESEANDFAARTLVPPQFQYAMMGLPLNSHSVIRFARRIGVAPGIVVGQLQHHGRIKHNQLNGLKRRFKWDD